MILYSSYTFSPYHGLFIGFSDVYTMLPAASNSNNWTNKCELNLRAIFQHDIQLILEKYLHFISRTPGSTHHEWLVGGMDMVFVFKTEQNKEA